jgi:hypothetical protein
MALDTASDPCNLLNNTDYPTLWVYGAFDTDAFSKIFEGGSIRTYTNTLAAIADKAKPVLKTTSNTHRLIHFLNGKTFAMVNNDKPIVDNYISLLNKPSYTFSTNENPTITDNDIITIVDKLLSEHILLNKDELFNPLQFGRGAVLDQEESLIYLYSIEENASKSLTPRQLGRKTVLEQRNHLFFSNFLMEYCFFKTRYNIILTKYFDLYTKPATTTIPTSKDIFGVGVPAPESASAGFSQKDYLKALAYHLACINTRMTDMRRVLSEITSRYNIIFQTIQSAINDGSIPGSNVELTSTIQTLNASAKDVNAYLAEADFKKGVMDYNSEKNRYANMMLTIYAFLNIAGIATIYHLASSS